MPNALYKRKNQMIEKWALVMIGFEFFTEKLPVSFHRPVLLNIPAYRKMLIH
jgi:hypothetical protein